MSLTSEKKCQGRNVTVGNVHVYLIFTHPLTLHRTLGRYTCATPNREQPSCSFDVNELRMSGGSRRVMKPVRTSGPVPRGGKAGTEGKKKTTTIKNHLIKKDNVATTQSPAEPETSGTVSGDTALTLPPPRLPRLPRLLRHIGHQNDGPLDHDGHSFKSGRSCDVARLHPALGARGQPRVLGQRSVEPSPGTSLPAAVSPAVFPRGSLVQGPLPPPDPAEDAGLTPLLGSDNQWDFGLHFPQSTSGQLADAFSGQ